MIPHPRAVPPGVSRPCQARLPGLACLLLLCGSARGAESNEFLPSPYPEGFIEYAREGGRVAGPAAQVLQGELHSQVFNRPARLPGTYTEATGIPFVPYGQKESEYLFPGTGPHWQQVRVTIYRAKDSALSEAWASPEQLSRALALTELVPGYPMSGYPSGYITARHDPADDVWHFEIPAHGEVWLIGRKGSWLYTIKGYGSNSSVLKAAERSLPLLPLTPPAGFKITPNSVFVVNSAALLQANRDACEAFARMIRAQLSALPDVPPEPTDVPWAIAIGAGAAGAAAVAAAAKAIAGSSSKGSGKDKQSSQAPVGYVLQVSTAEVDLSRGSPQPLTVTAWAVDPKGGYRAAPEAEIALAPSGSTARLISVNPGAGRGTVQCQVGAAEGATSTAAFEASLDVTASAPGGKGTTAQVRITCHQPVIMEFF